MNMSLKTITTALLVAGIAITGCKKPVENEVTTPKTNEFHFNFDNYFGDTELKLNTETYTTAQSEEIKITAFDYWVTNMKFVNSDGTEYAEPESYRLLRGDKHATHHFHVASVPAGTYTAVKFLIGVDKARNTSGAQTGALDPTENGDMFWSWNTGYIQAKLEGTSPQATSKDNIFRYHIGGVKDGIETPQEVTLTFPQPVVIGDQAGTAKVKVDVAKWFPTPMSIAMMPEMMHPNEMAYNIAKGYVDMFSITSAGNE